MADKMAGRRRKRHLAKREEKANSRGKTLKSLSISNKGDPVVNRTGSGFHSSKSGNKGYTRHPKHKDRNN